MMHLPRNEPYCVRITRRIIRGKESCGIAWYLVVRQEEDGFPLGEVVDNLVQVFLADESGVVGAGRQGCTTQTTFL